MLTADQEIMLLQILRLNYEILQILKDLQQALLEETPERDLYDVLAMDSEGIAS